MRVTILFILLLTHGSIFAQEDNAINRPSLQKIVFKKNSEKLTKEHKAVLDSIIILSKQYPAFTLAPCYFFSCKPKSNKLIDDRLTVVVDYLLLNGIDTGKIHLGFSHMEKAEIIAFRFDIINLSDPPQPHPNTLKNEAIKTRNE